ARRRRHRGTHARAAPARRPVHRRRHRRCAEGRRRQDGTRCAGRISPGPRHCQRPGKGAFEMSPFWGHLAGVVTVVAMIAFIGIWIWAWLPTHKTEFDELATLPMEDEISPNEDELAFAPGGSALGRPGGAGKEEP